MFLIVEAPHLRLIKRALPTMTLGLLVGHLSIYDWARYGQCSIFSCHRTEPCYVKDDQSSESPDITPVGSLIQQHEPQIDNSPQLSFHDRRAPPSPPSNPRENAIQDDDADLQADPGSLDVSEGHTHVPSAACKEPNLSYSSANASSFEEPDLPEECQMWELQMAQKFINSLKNASLEESNISPEELYRLRNPPQTPITEEIDATLRFSLDLYMSTQHASQQTYTNVCKTI